MTQIRRFLLCMVAFLPIAGFVALGVGAAPALGADPLPIVVIDTLSLALGGDDEKGPRAPGFIKDCLDLLKERPDLSLPEEVCEGDEEAR